MATTAHAELKSLRKYSDKRDFTKTSEPAPRLGLRRSQRQLSYVIQKHWASHLHYDFRLEFDGVLLSWAVPKGPSLDPTVKRMAVHVEDHPVHYGKFEGKIPAKQYGAGDVIVWDRGSWTPVGDPKAGMKKGKLEFALHGEKLAGLWEMIRMADSKFGKDQWLLFKKRDGWARSATEYDVVSALPDSVVAHPLGLLEDREEPGDDAGTALPAPPSPARKSGTKSTSKSVSKSSTSKSAPSSKADIAALALAATNAVKKRLPAALLPQLATLAKEPPTIGDWVYEIKFDGYRIMTRFEKGKVRMNTRGGHDWADKIPKIAGELLELGLDSAILDGEIVAIGDDGVPNFNTLQNAFDTHRDAPIYYFIFDIPFVHGVDLRATPYSERKAILKTLLAMKSLEHIRYTEDFATDPVSAMKGVCEAKLEGLIAKRTDAGYASERTKNWLKLKCSERQEFVIVGYTDRKNSTTEIGSLLLGYYEGGQLRYAGNVGTGWNAATATELHTKLKKLAVKTPTVDAELTRPGRWSARGAGSEHWVKPVLVAEVRFAEWTPKHHIRHASFQGLRVDKAATEVGREIAQSPPARKKMPKTTPAHKSAVSSPAKPGSSARDQVGAISISHGERVIDPSTGLTKLQLVRYYESVAERMLPHLKGRPVSFLRAPSGVDGPKFFQKHDEKLSIPGVLELAESLWQGHGRLLEVPSEDVILSAAQMNVIEFHTWNSLARKIDLPDRMIFDLDPGEGVAWTQVQESAILVRALLTEIGLESWVKTSGGKGLHVAVPLTPKLDYDTVKDFSQAFVQHLAQTIPARFVATSGARNRVGKVFVDYLRNGHGQTTAAAFSARARAGLGVSIPIEWDQVAELKSGAQWTIVNARDYLSFEKVDPWAAYWKTRQTLAKPMKALKFEPSPK